LICATAVVLFAGPIAALADCCSCTGSDPDQKICLTIQSGGCATLKQQASSNAVVGSLNCDTTTSVPDSQCKTVSDGGTCFAVGDALTYGMTGANGTPTPTGDQLVIPKLNVDIPGLQFATVAPSTGGKLQIPFLAQYIAAVYHYLLGISVIAAAVM